MSPQDPQLFFSDDGTPRSARFGDIYYSPQDGLAESRAVFLNGCHLPQGWEGCADFTVLELGFGTGLNIAALMQLWSQARPANGRLHVFSIEGFLMEREAAATALGNWPELAPFSEALLAQWPRARAGFHHMDFPQWGISLTVGLMDVEAAMTAWQGRADAVFLDGFSPALNPGMWSDAVFAGIAAKTRPGARLATFTVAGFVRRGLQAQGFTVQKCQGFGRKRERLEAVLAGAAEPHAERPKRIAVLGAGIAGASLAWQARLAGLAVDLFDGEGEGAGASGNPAALVTPRLDAGDAAISTLFADAHAYAAQLYPRICPEAILSTGVLLCESGPRDAHRFERIKDQPYFAAGDLSRFHAGEVPDLPQSGGLRLNAAFCVRPDRLLAALLGGQGIIKAQVASCEPVGGGVTLQLMDGDRRTYDAVVWACGEGLFDLETPPLRGGLRPVRGQLETAQGVMPPDQAATWGHYAVPLPDGVVFGATHDRDDRGREGRAEDRARNLAGLSERLPQVAVRIAAADMESRASVRVVTRDYLPVAGEVQPGIHVLSGLGGRGFCLAPLLAKAVVADLTGAPSPLPAIAKKLLNPHRLTKR